MESPNDKPEDVNKDVEEAQEQIKQDEVPAGEDQAGTGSAEGATASGDVSASEEHTPDKVEPANEASEANEATNEEQTNAQASEANVQASEANVQSDEANIQSDEANTQSGEVTEQPGEANDEANAQSGEAQSTEVNDNEDADGEEVYKLRAHRRSKPSTAKPKERRRERRQAPVEQEQEEEPAPQEENLTSEERERRELEARIDAALAPASKKRKKLSADDIEMLQDDAIAKLRDDMRNVALQDVECIQNGTPAINKVRMLPQVVKTLQKSALADSILDGNLLESVRIWLEPLPDASLPSFEIQKAMFTALTTLPIKTIHLRESGLGRVVLFYQRSKRPHPQIKRLAQKLIGDWTRPIIGRSDNYRDKRVATATFDPNQGSALRKTQAINAASSAYEESAQRRNRAAIPTQAGVSYQIAPVSNIMGPESAGQSKDSQLRRMKTKLMANRAKGRKNQVSVEGKGLH